MTNSKILGIALVAVVIATLGLFLPKGNTVVQQVTEKLGADAGPTHFGLNEFLGGFIRGNYYATSTVSTAFTLRAADLIGYDFISVTPLVGDLTYTFMASSSASNLVPKAGMTQETCIRNATTTAGIDITFAAGTGIDLETASSTITDLTLSTGNTACFTFIRQQATTTTFDISVLMTEYNNGD